MEDDSLSALEDRVEKLLALVAELRKEKEGWEKERTAIKSKVAGMLERIEKVIGKGS